MWGAAKSRLADPLTLVKNLDCLGWVDWGWKQAVPEHRTGPYRKLVAERIAEEETSKPMVRWEAVVLWSSER